MKKIKKIISVALALATLMQPLQLQASHPFDAITSTAEATSSIARVQVVEGGEIQHRYRDTVYRGTGVGGYTQGFYTTLRDASLTDPRIFTIRTELTSAQVGNPATFLNRVNYTYGGIDLEDWLGRAGRANNIALPFTNESNRFISKNNHRLIRNNMGFILETEIFFNKPFNRSATDINVPYDGYVDRGQHQTSARVINQMVGTFDLEIFVDETIIGSVPIRLNFYDGFNTWEQIESWIQDLKELETNHFVYVEEIGRSWQDRPIYTIIIAASEEAVLDYFESTRPYIITDPMSLVANEHKKVIYFNNNHPDEVTGVDAQLVLIEKILNNDIISFESARYVEGITHGIFENAGIGPSGYASTARVGTATDTHYINVGEMLEDFILVFSPTNNPDGRYHMSRWNQALSTDGEMVNSFDINRDSAAQVQLESQYLVRDLMRWHPLVMVELHGHVRHLLIEPCTVPGNPNNEYDLIRPAMIRQANTMGRAAISGAYDRFLIPAEHMADGWDDAGPMYTPVFATLFGVLGYTIEIPSANRDSLDANVSIMLGAIYDSMMHFEELFENKMQVLQRGIDGEDNRGVDQFLTNPEQIILGRPRAGNDSFFPDYFVIPADLYNQANIQAAYEMLVQLARHDVKIDKLLESVFHEGVYFPQGSYVIDMRQAHRGYVNNMIGTGFDVSNFPRIYSEITVNFPAARGFTSFEARGVELQTDRVFNGNHFDGKQMITGFSMPQTIIPDTAYVLIHNMGNDAIRLANRLLDDEKTVFINANGDFIVERKNLAEIDDLFVVAEPLSNNRPAGLVELQKPHIAILGTNISARFMVQQLGFSYTMIMDIDEFTENWQGFTAILNNNTSVTEDALEILQKAVGYGLNYFGVHRNGLQTAVDVLGLDAEIESHNVNGAEGVFKAQFNPGTRVSGRYDLHNAILLTGREGGSGALGFFADDFPVGITPLITIDSSFEHFYGGWFPVNSNLRGRVVAFTSNHGDGIVTAFGGAAFNQAHHQALNNIFASTIFMP